MNKLVVLVVCIILLAGQSVHANPAKSCKSAGCGTRSQCLRWMGSFSTNAECTTYCERSCSKTMALLSDIIADLLIPADDEELIPWGESEAPVFSHTALGTAYFPDASPMEGGYKDRLGKPLRTLQQFLAGKARYVSVAMDAAAFKYGTILKIPHLEKKYGRAIRFCVCDTGSAFKGKGTSRMDICVQNRKASLDQAINRSFSYKVTSIGNGKSC